ncbi:MAG: hypothetical protein LBD38_04965, partial [Streptococcaceae bacterium]|nr:hypothetical protein [Streptococcaceae bacterium]
MFQTSLFSKTFFFFICALSFSTPSLVMPAQAESPVHAALPLLSTLENIQEESAPFKNGQELPTTFENKLEKSSTLLGLSDLA